MSHKAMGASSPMCDLLVVRCSNIFFALRHSWRARCRNIFAQSIRTVSSLGGGGGGHQVTPPPQPQLQCNLKENFLRRLWRPVFLCFLGQGDGPPHGGGGGCKGWGGGLYGGGGGHPRKHSFSVGVIPDHFPLHFSFWPLGAPLGASSMPQLCFHGWAGTDHFKVFERT